MKWKTLATKITNRLRSGSASSVLDPSSTTTTPSSSSASVMEEQQQKYSSRRKSEPNTIPQDDLAMDNVQVMRSRSSNGNFDCIHRLVSELDP